MRRPAMRLAGRGDQAGSALLGMILVTFTLVAISVAYITIVPTSLRSMRGRASQARATYWAFEAAARARVELAAGLDGNVDGNAIAQQTTEPDDDIDGPFGTLRTAADGTFVARAAEQPDGTFVIEAAGVMEGTVQRIVQVVRRESASPYTAGAFAATELEYDDDDDDLRFLSDSYDSSLGTYAAQAVNSRTMPDGRAYTYARERSKLASNGDIELPRGAVFGDVEPGPGASFEPDKHTYVTGSTVPASTSRDLEPVAYVEPATNDNANASVSPYLQSGIYWVDTNKPAATIPAGDYVFDHFVAAGQTVTVNGRVRLYVRGAFYVLSTSVTLAPGASLEVYQRGEGELYFSGTGMVNPSDKPANLRFYMSDGGDGVAPKVTLAQSADFVGAVYAPQSRIVFQSRRVRGALVADVLRLDRDASQSLHYDEALARLEDAAPRVTRFEVLHTYPLQK